MVAGTSRARTIGGVEQDGERDAEPERLDQHDVGRDEREADDDDDQRRAGDDPAAALQARRATLRGVVAGLQPGLPDAR